jgi:hypothetical protein
MKSPRLEILLKPGVKMVRSDELTNEFENGRLPFYVLSQNIMTKNERAVLNDEILWFTKPFCDYTIKHSFYSKYGTGFRVWVNEYSEETQGMTGQDKELAGQLEALLKLTCCVPVSKSEWKCIAEIIGHLRLAGYRDPLPYSKWFLFDRGIIRIHLHDILSRSSLRSIIRNDRERIHKLLSYVSVSIGNRLLKKLRRHPQYVDLRSKIKQYVQKWMNL